jgi:hypothetical protein
VEARKVYSFDPAFAKPIFSLTLAAGFRVTGRSIQPSHCIADRRRALNRAGRTSVGAGLRRLL